MALVAFLVGRGDLHVKTARLGGRACDLVSGEAQAFWQTFSLVGVRCRAAADGQGGLGIDLIDLASRQRFRCNFNRGRGSNDQRIGHMALVAFLVGRGDLHVKTARLGGRACDDTARCVKRQIGRQLVRRPRVSSAATCGCKRGCRIGDTDPARRKARCRDDHIGWVNMNANICIFITKYFILEEGKKVISSFCWSSFNIT